MGISRIVRERLEPFHRHFVVEMGAYGPGSIERLCRLAPPDIAVVTAVGPAHYERFKSLDTVARTKFELPAAAIARGGKAIVSDAVLAFPDAQRLRRRAPRRDDPGRRRGGERRQDRRRPRRPKRASPSRWPMRAMHFTLVGAALRAPPRPQHGARLRHRARHGRRRGDRDPRDALDAADRPSIGGEAPGRRRHHRRRWLQLQSRRLRLGARPPARAGRRGRPPHPDHAGHGRARRGPRRRAPQDRRQGGLHRRHPPRRVPGAHRRPHRGLQGRRGRWRGGGMRELHGGAGLDGRRTCGPGTSSSSRTTCPISTSASCRCDRG